VALTRQSCTVLVAAGGPHRRACLSRHHRPKPARQLSHQTRPRTRKPARSGWRSRDAEDSAAARTRAAGGRPLPLPLAPTRSALRLGEREWGRMRMHVYLFLCNFFSEI
jgi:hypothetical protein